MARLKVVETDRRDVPVTRAPAPLAGAAPDPALAWSRFGLRSFYLFLAVLCGMLVAVESRESDIVLMRVAFLVGALLFGSIALMPARKLDDVFLRPPPAADD